MISHFMSVAQLLELREQIFVIYHFASESCVVDVGRTSTVVNVASDYTVFGDA